MKKLLAVLLAVAMVASMAAVSFAATQVNEGVCMLAGSPYRYDEDYDEMYSYLTEYGEAAYFYLLRQTNSLDANDNGDYTFVTDNKMVDGLKIKMDYEMGEELVESVQLVKKKLASDSIGWLDWDHADTPALLEAFSHHFTGYGETDYVYFVEVKTKKQETTSDADIIATIELNKSKAGADKPLSYKVKDLKTDIAINVCYDWNYNEDSWLHVKNDSVTDVVYDGYCYLDPDTYYLLKYDYDEETEFTFGSWSSQNEGTFTVDVSGQGKNLLYFDTIPDEAIAAANSDATLFALNFNNTKFNRTGEFIYEADELNYAYQVMEDGSLKLLGEFDNGEVSFNTRVLGKYLFSDIELVAPEKEVEETVSVEPADGLNPGTGGL